MSSEISSAVYVGAPIKDGPRYGQTGDVGWLPAPSRWIFMPHGDTEYDEVSRDELFFADDRAQLNPRL